MTFGAITTLGRLAYDGGSNPLTVVLLRLCTFVFVVGLLLVALRRPGRLTLRAFLATLWMAVTLTMMSVGYLGSVAFIPVSLAALIFYSFPLLVGVITAAAGRERMTGGKAAALLVAFIGLALALGPASRRSTGAASPSPSPQRSEWASPSPSAARRCAARIRWP